MCNDEDYRAARERTIKKMLNMCEWLTHDALVERIGQPWAEEAIVQWETEQRIFSIPSEDGKLYPRFQFDETMKPVLVIKDILALLAKDDSIAIAAWFIFKNGWIEKIVDGKIVSVAPMHALEDREAVLAAARNERGTHFA
ncbi:MULTISPECIES: hypothetical protein [Duganella]|uniref:DUF2384 domain-containing protein n=2 Tax=Duganella TaxID=75654 RepID=A0A845GR91_9BURK|nr:MULTISPECIES: hypothetical protein [Duganella]MYM80771.1 hypothetical protein [Duganella lactea]MYM96125.1 hypothetical protein [Duganella vulcania]